MYKVKDITERANRLAPSVALNGILASDSVIRAGSQHTIKPRYQ